MATNIWVNPERFRKVGQELHINGMELVVQVSPYDIPTNIHGRHVKSSKSFEITFDYFDNETPGPPVVQDKIRFIPGKFSGKLLKIIIPVDSQPMDEIGVIQLRTEVLNALQNRSERLNPIKDTSRPVGSYLNSEGVRDALQDEETFRSVVSELVAH